MKNNELKHHGIKGQKWGVRRFQNEDGTLTDKGTARAQRDLKKLAKLKSKYEAEKLVKGWRRDTSAINEYRQMAEQYVKKLEKRYSNMSIKDIHISDPEVRNGRVFVGTALGYSGNEDGGYPLFQVTAGHWTKIKGE